MPDWRGWCVVFEDAWWVCFVVWKTETNVVVEDLEERDNQLQAHRSISIKGPM